MRLAADLVGIVTPTSLAGYETYDFGIEMWSPAMIALEKFESAYTKIST